MRFPALTGTMLALAFSAGCGSSAAQNNATVSAPPGAMTLRYASPERPDDTLTIERDAAGRVRAEDGDGQLLIIREGTTYLNPQPPGGGERVVARLDDLVALGGEMRARMLRSGALSGDRDDTAYALRDEGEAIVGQWRGRRYSVDPDGSGVSLTAVIAADPALADARALAVSVFDAFEAPMRATLIFPEQFTRLRAEVLGRGMPILFEGRELRSIERAPVPEARFALPGPVLSREALRARFMP